MALQPAPSALRTVEIVRFLAERPGEVFAVADLARRLGQSRATCQAVLLALEPSGWVRRGEGGYALGPGLIAVGAAAQRGAPLVALLRDATRALNGETGREILGYLVSGDQLINVSRVGPVFPMSITSVEGQSFPFAPPNGLACAAWDETELEAWIARAPSIGSRGRARLRQAAAIVRTLGYSVMLDPVTRREFSFAVDGLSDGLRQLVASALAHDDLVRVDLEEVRAMRVSLLSAPVFNADGKVVALIGVIFGPEEYTRVPEMAEALLSSGRQLSTSLGAPDPALGEARPA